MTEVTMIRVLFRKETIQHTTWWVGQCLDFDLVAQAMTLRAAMEEVKNALLQQAVLDEQHHIKPFSSLGIPPPHFEEWYREGVSILDNIAGLELDARVW